jgi:hypothetical protein
MNVPVEGPAMLRKIQVQVCDVVKFVDDKEKKALVGTKAGSWSRKKAR